jgi:UDP-N-acetylglucosamine 3-dehydrogenase
MLKIGVIGLGSMGKNHARVCSEIENIELIGVSDINKKTAKEIAEKFDTKTFFDYKELIPHIDAAIIATPTVTHHKIALDLIEEGKHVLVEKPICENIKKSEELVNKAKKENLILAVGHIERHNPAVGFIKDSLEKKKFGDLITLNSRRVSNFPGRIKDVGVVMDLGIHDIDIMYYLAGDVKSVYTRAGKFNKTIEYEDYANIILNFKNYVCGIVEVNWLTPMKVRKLFLTCSENYVEADYINQSVTISSSLFKKVDLTNLYRVPIQYNVNKVALEKKEPLKNEINDFIKAVKEHKKPLASGEDGLIALKIAEAATISYKKGEEVKVL